VSERRLQRYACANIPPRLNSIPRRQALLNHNAKVYIATRNREKTESAIQDLKAETGKEAIFLKLDLASLKSVKAAAEEFLRFILLRLYDTLTPSLTWDNACVQQGDRFACPL
jgi:hypothetical protein